MVKSEHLYRADTSDRPQHVAFGVGGTESCYLKQSVPYNNTDWTDPAVSWQSMSNAWSNVDISIISLTT